MSQHTQDRATKLPKLRSLLPTSSPLVQCKLTCLWGPHQQRQACALLCTEWHKEWEGIPCVCRGFLVLGVRRETPITPSAENPEHEGSIPGDTLHGGASLGTPACPLDQQGYAGVPQGRPLHQLDQQACRRSPGTPPPLAPWQSPWLRVSSAAASTSSLTLR